MKETFTISEYNEKTKKYTEIGHVTANSRDEAKKQFILENNWKKRKGFCLFVRNPVCR